MAGPFRSLKVSPITFHPIIYTKMKHNSFLLEKLPLELRTKLKHKKTADTLDDKHSSNEFIDFQEAGHCWSTL